MNQLLKTVEAGSLTANDIKITLTPGKPGSGISIDLKSTVLIQFGDNICEILKSIIEAHEVTDVHVSAIDEGALEYTIRARILTVLSRAGVQLKESFWQ